VQSSFFDARGIAELGSLGGVSGAKLVDWLPHGRYAVKEHSGALPPYTLVSEWLAADVASLLDLPVPARQVVPCGQNDAFGLEWRADAKSFQPGMEAKLTNPEAVIGMIAFDVFVCNRDRHSGNVLLQRPSPDMERYTLYLVDHSHALIGDLADMGDFARWCNSHPDPGSFIQVAPQELRGLVDDLARFDPWVSRIGALTRSQFEESAARIPTSWKPSPDEIPSLIDFLISRQNAMQGLIGQAGPYLPNLNVQP